MSDKHDCSWSRRAGGIGKRMHNSGVYDFPCEVTEENTAMSETTTTATNEGNNDSGKEPTRGARKKIERINTLLDELYASKDSCIRLLNKAENTFDQVGIDKYVERLKKIVDMVAKVTAVRNKYAKPLLLPKPRLEGDEVIVPVVDETGEVVYINVFLKDYERETGETLEDAQDTRHYGYGAED